jgi:hypothetical protein
VHNGLITGCHEVLFTDESMVQLLMEKDMMVNPFNALLICDYVNIFLKIINSII